MHVDEPKLDIRGREGEREGGREGGGEGGREVGREGDRERGSSERAAEQPPTYSENSPLSTCLPRQSSWYSATAIRRSVTERNTNSRCAPPTWSALTVLALEQVEVGAQVGMAQLLQRLEPASGVDGVQSEGKSLRVTLVGSMLSGVEHGGAQKGRSHRSCHPQRCSLSQILSTH